MRTLFLKESFDEVTNRINKLTLNSQKLWGKMSVDQMLAHCSIGIETAIGTKFFSQLFIEKLIGRFFKSMEVEEKPIKKNSPTNHAFIIKSTEGFEKKQNLFRLIYQFHQGGEARCTTNPHSFFGKLTPSEWGSLMYKHIDHHLKQFSV